ncbi:transposase family protein [Burkholderia pyrrocinia]|nr:transposase family protein [Burkholderia pyrrocinia]
MRSLAPLKKGISLYDTFGRVLAALDPKQFEACFPRWISRVCPALPCHIAFDEVTVRRICQHGERAIHMVSVYESGLDFAPG